MPETAPERRARIRLFVSNQEMDPQARFLRAEVVLGACLRYAGLTKPGTGRSCSARLHFEISFV